MRKNTILLILSSFIFASVSVAKTSPVTQRIGEFSNKSVHVWKTIIYPSAKHMLSMHRHEHDRVLVALTDGTLKVTDDQGKVHYLHLQKDKAYYLKKDVPNTMHTDENISSHPITVFVVELMGA